ncbi:hypothetical protein MNBD_GAMMA09-3130 [hydrothermal vent metagenome]|uniref:Outer membrane protein beta-barrel domain-containing protein n=1 Tax=hydrothermal vent metagenome TaxID=652676 RepID=A0A3B0XQF0_9ZZZZ
MLKVFLLLLFFISSSANSGSYYAGFDVGYADQFSTVSVDEYFQSTINNNVEKDYQPPLDTSSAYSFFLGYKIAADIALELGFTQMAELTGDLHVLDDGNPLTNQVAEETVKSKFSYLAIVAVFPVYHGLCFNARLGVSNWEYTLSQEVFEIDDSAAASPFPNPPSEPVILPDGVKLSADSRVERYSDTGADFYYGAGMSYALYSQLEIRLQVDFHRYTAGLTNVNVRQETALLYLGAVFHY